jgi:hypothetical protein
MLGSTLVSNSSQFLSQLEPEFQTSSVLPPLQNDVLLHISHRPVPLLSYYLALRLYSHCHAHVLTTKLRIHASRSISSVLGSGSSQVRFENRKRTAKWRVSKDDGSAVESQLLQTYRASVAAYLIREALECPPLGGHAVPIDGKAKALNHIIQRYMRINLDLSSAALNTPKDILASQPSTPQTTSQRTSFLQTLPAHKMALTTRHLAVLLHYLLIPLLLELMWTFIVLYLINMAQTLFIGIYPILYATDAEALCLNFQWIAKLVLHDAAFMVGLGFAALVLEELFG